MSFGSQVKDEICHYRSFPSAYRIARTYGLLLFGKTFGIESMSIHTEHKTVARLYADSISNLVELTGSITLREIKRAGRVSIYMVTVDSHSDRSAILSCFGYNANEDCNRIRTQLLDEQGIPLFISGAFLACGMVSDPEKSYHLEFAIPHKPLSDDLEALLSARLTPPKVTVRRNHYLLYYKESEPIEDLLICAGATNSALELMEVKIVKGLRNKVNRETNCETANITKTIDAAMRQVQDIELIASSCGIDALEDDLQQLAQLRLDNPEMSLRELGEMLSPPLSRSGVNHRLKRICTFANTLK